MDFLGKWMWVGALAAASGWGRAADPPRVRASRDATGVVIQWDGKGVLQVAPTAAGPWTDMVNAVSPHRAVPGDGRGFFRVVAGTGQDPTVINPFVNGDFEQGPRVGWLQEPGEVIFPVGQLGGAQPYSGRYAVWLGYGQDGRTYARMGQRVTLPGTKPLYLNFALYLHSEESCDVPYYDAVTLYINGVKTVENDRVCQGTVSERWQRFSVDITALAGTSAAFVFEISSVDTLASVALIDDVAVSNIAWGLEN